MSLEYLQEYQTFKSVRDMDKSNQLHIQNCNLSKTDLKVIYYLAGTTMTYAGVTIRKGLTIAKDTGLSRATVVRCIARLVKHKIIKVVNTKKMNGIIGANVYIFLPYDEPTEMSQRETANEVSNDAVFKDENKDVITTSFSTYSLKQVNNINNLHSEIATQVENEKAFMDEYQSQLFDLTKDLPLGETVRNELSKMILSITLTSKKEMIAAYKLIFDIALRLQEGTLTVERTLRSLFKAGFNVRKESTSKTSPVEVKPRTEDAKVVKFYNWLEERDDNRPHSVTPKPNIYNWLTEGGC